MPSKGLTAPSTGDCRNGLKAAVWRLRRSVRWAFPSTGKSQAHPADESQLVLLRLRQKHLGLVWHRSARRGERASQPHAQGWDRRNGRDQRYPENSKSCTQASSTSALAASPPLGAQSSHDFDVDSSTSRYRCRTTGVTPWGRVGVAAPSPLRSCAHRRSSAGLGTSATSPKHSRAAHGPKHECDRLRRQPDTGACRYPR